MRVSWRRDSLGSRRLSRCSRHSLSSKAWRNGELAACPLMNERMLEGCTRIFGFFFSCCDSFASRLASNQKMFQELQGRLLTFDSAGSTSDCSSGGTTMLCSRLIHAHVGTEHMASLHESFPCIWRMMLPIINLNWLTRQRYMQ